MNAVPLLVTVELAGPLGCEPPALDALCESVMATLLQFPTVDRRRPAPDPRNIPNPIASTAVGDGRDFRRVFHCSSPIIATPSSDRHEHYHRRYPVSEAARLCAPGERSIVSTVGFWTKSYRLPLRVRLVSRIAWICEGNRRELRKTLRHVAYLGKKRSHGYGPVARRDVQPPGEETDAEGESGGQRPLAWKVERRPDLAGCWWYAPSPGGTVLMRPLPADMPGLPPDLIGCRAEYGACSPPYWHPDRYGEIVSPC